ncbi:MAG: hypothetical protein KF775_10145 [Cyclobacteriaceae bacterium]|nr:hypothetical protein [Cyclobacteriaceae bacterium]
MRVLVVFFFLTSGLIAFGQSTTVLENNPNLQWKQVKSPHFRVVFPKGFEVQGMRMANTLEHIREPESRSLGTTPRPISVILQNQSAISNGFVSITPRRSEFFAMPSQNYNFMGTLDWLDLLAVHEYRHVVQFNHSNRGFNKALYYLFGANTQAAMSYVAVPQWFWEGDAVATETAFTQSGRGRIPYFNLLFRTNLLEGRAFNYNKQYLRSYKHNIPDHYVLGYHMVGYLRQRTNNPEAWENITRRAWQTPFMPFTFSRAIKKETGLYVKDLYKEMAVELQKEWQQEQDNLNPTPFESITKRTSDAYTDYRFPQEAGNDSIVAIKSGIGDIEELVLLTAGKEKKLLTLGPYNQTGMLSAAAGRVVWNEYRYDPRWRVKTYSVIVAYDLATRQRKQLTIKSRYASAALSPNGKRVATIETGTDYQTRLVILDYETGAVVQQFENPDNDFISMPRWTADGKEVIALATGPAGKQLISYTVASGLRTNYTEPTQENIGYPVAWKEYIFFNSPRSGIDNIYVLNKTDQKVYQLTVSRYGAYNPEVSASGNLYYNEQTRDGQDIVVAPLNASTWQETPAFTTQPGVFLNALVEQEGNPHLLNVVPKETYPVKKYSRVAHLLNPYNWGAYLDNTLTRVDVGINSRDVLNNLSLNAGYLYDVNERTGSWSAGMSYQGAYPILDVTVSKSSRAITEGNLTYDKVVGTDTTTVTENLKFTWQEKTLEAGLRLPLLTTSSRFLSLFSVFNYVGVKSISDFQNSIDGGGRLLPANYPQYFFRNYLDKGSLVYNYFGMRGYMLQKRSRRDINSKWGMAFFLDYFDTPNKTDYSGNQVSVQTQLYAPGLFKHHSLWGYWAYQNAYIADVRVSSGTGLNNYTFRNQIPLPRGLAISRFQNFYSMSGNYTLPVWYPDVHLGPLVNVQRVRANLFLDYGFGSSLINNRAYSATYLSTGAEVKFDVNLLRTLPQFDFGFRYSYGLNPATTRFELLLSSINF